MLVDYIIQELFMVVTLFVSALMEECLGMVAHGKMVGA